MTACMYGKVTTTVYLLGRGARHDLVDINGDSAVHWAAFKGNLSLLRKFRLFFSEIYEFKRFFF